MSFFKKVKFFLPWTYPSVLRGLIPDSTVTVLDVGCGDGQIMSWINFDGKYQAVGLDVKKSDLEIAKRTGTYTKLVCLNLTKDKLPKKKFDVTMCSQVVEHLNKQESLKLIESMEKLTAKRVIIATINGYFPYDHKYSENKYDEHRSGWELSEFTKRGYQVIGHGIKFIYQPGGLKDRLPFLRPILFGISYLLNPLIKQHCKWALFIIAWKDLSYE